MGWVLCYAYTGLPVPGVPRAWDCSYGIACMAFVQLGYDVRDGLYTVERVTRASHDVY